MSYPTKETLPCLLLALSLALGAGCALDDEGKDLCELPTDCVAGAACIEGVCEGGTGTGGEDGDDRPNPGGEDGSPGNPDEEPFALGTVEPMSTPTAGLTTVNYDTMLGLSSATGGLGCAVVGDQAAAPGQAASAVYAKVYAESGDSRCPDGIFSIQANPERCEYSYEGPGGGIADGCAVYKRWDASGELVARQLATGGFVSIANTQLGDYQVRCGVELSLSFEGGTTVSKIYQFEYSELGPESAFCTP